MSNIIYNGHVQCLILNTSGQTPTVPSPSTLIPTEAGWNDTTDIMIGEFALNSVDGIVYTRGNSGIFAIIGGSGSGVQTITGFKVNNTDPSNPVIEQPSPAEIGAPSIFALINLESQLNDHIADPSGAHQATAISNNPFGGISSTTVQGALNELDNEKESAANKDTDGTLAADSDIRYPSQKAIKTYVDAKVIDSILDGDITHAPSRNAVFDALLLKSDLSYVNIEFAKKSNLIKSLGAAAITRADGVTYYWGPFWGLPPQAGAAQSARFKFDRPGIITRALLEIRLAITGTNESVPLNLRVNNTTNILLLNIDYSTIPTNSSIPILVTGLNISVNTTDTYEMQEVVPVMSTNPSNVIVMCHFFTD